MASNSETGHAVNIANFKLLIDNCTGFGATYSPGNADLTIANMTGLWSAANSAQTGIRNAQQNSKQPINAREILFEPLRTLVTQVI